MITIWNTFCEDISKNKTVKEMVFEKDVVKSFLQALGWSKYQRNLKEQLGLYKGKWRPDFIFYMDGNEDNKEIILELKKPDHKQRKADIEQIEAYMKLTDCRFGLYFGEKLEVFYLQDKEGKRSAVSVTNIDWHQDNAAGVNLIELLYFDHYDREKLENFCLDHLYLNAFLNHCKHQGGQKQLYDCIMENFTLPSSMADILRTRLKFIIEDNLEAAEQPTIVTPVRPTTSQVATGEIDTWLICYDKKYFDVEGCFKKFGQIYWKHKAGILNVKKGDIAYLYSTSPESAIRFKVEIIESQLPYSKEMDVEDEFLKSGNSNSDDSNRKFFLVRPIAETHSSALKHSTMQNAGLIGKRPSATKLSKAEFKALKEYIEEHFNDATTAEEKPTLKPKKEKKKVSEKPKRKTPLPPFKFSMIGLKPGDKIVFDVLNLEVTVASDNTISHNGKEYKLTTFCKEFLPIEKQNKSNAYQGPDYFSYQGKKLAKIRKEMIKGK